MFLIFQYLINLVPGRRRVPSGRFSSKNAAVMAGTTRGQGRFGRLGNKRKTPLFKFFITSHFKTHSYRHSAPIIPEQRLQWTALLTYLLAIFSHSLFTSLHYNNLGSPFIFKCASTFGEAVVGGQKLSGSQKCISSTPTPDELIAPRCDSTV